MNIGIDGYEANTKRRVGIGQYAFQILKQLHRQDKENHYTVFIPNMLLSDMPVSRTGWHYIIGTPGPFWTSWQLPRLIKAVSLDLFFSPTHYSPLFVSLPKIVSVMDLSYLHFPKMFKHIDLFKLKYLGGHSIKRADKILTISEFSKREIVKYYRVREDKVVVTYPGINIRNFNPRLVRFGRKKSKIKTKDKKIEKIIKGKFILFVGTMQPRKNIERLIAAFDKLNRDDLQLVLVGKKGWLFEPILNAAANTKRNKQIIFLNFVTNEELAVLYKNATVFVLPSLYEGFGIPIVEAMHYGVPVVVSNTSSLPEVAGSAGIYIDPLSVTSIAEGVKKALQLNQQEREMIVKKGKEQAGRFTWEKSAQRTLEVIKSIN